MKQKKIVYPYNNLANKAAAQFNNRSNFQIYKCMMSAQLRGELIADYIDNSPLSIIEKLRTMMHPNRFWVRDLIFKYNMILKFLYMPNH